MVVKTVHIHVKFYLMVTLLLYKQKVLLLSNNIKATNMHPPLPLGKQKFQRYLRF